jgi:hypothetical protein
MSFWRLWSPRQPNELREMETPVSGLPVIVFDVNETLLDLETLTPTFERIFGDRSVTIAIAEHSGGAHTAPPPQA